MDELTPLLDIYGEVHYRRQKTVPSSGKIFMASVFCAALCMQKEYFIYRFSDVSRKRINFII